MEKDKILIDIVDNKLVFEIPFIQDTLDWYGKKIGTMEAIVGLIRHEDYNDILTINHLIDMSYCGKAPQLGTEIINLSSFLNKDEFEKICRNLNIPLEIADTCYKCNKTIYPGEACNWDGGGGSHCFCPKS